MLDLKALENALAVISNVGKGEFTFTVDNVPVTMRVLTADEDLAVQRYARGSDDTEDKDEEANALPVLERFKRATLSYAIIQVGSTNLRDVDYIATGEMTDKGVPVKMPRHLAVRKIVDGWTRTATLALFQKYLELVRRVDVEAENAVQFNPTDLVAEIGRVEKRLAELKREKERMEGLKSTTSASQVANIAAVDQVVAQNLKDITERAAGQMPPEAPPRAAEVPPEPAPAVTFQSGTTPAPNVSVSPPPQPPPAAPAAARQRVLPAEAPPPPRPAPPRPAPPPEEPPSEGFGGVMDSLGDSPEAIAAETARIQAARMAARKASMDAIRSDATDVLPGVPTRRTPPHRAAAHVDAVVDMGGSSIEAARPTAGPVEGVEAYRLAPSPVTDRGRPNPNTRVPVDPKPKTGANNPRFKPPGR